MVVVEIGHSGKRVFTKAWIACGTCNIQAIKNSPPAISRPDDTRLATAAAEPRGMCSRDGWASSKALINKVWTSTLNNQGARCWPSNRSDR